MATIKDIAQRAGVSHATVSYVLNHKGNVSSKKIKLVEEAAKAMGYQLNGAASSLRSGRVKTVAVVLPTIHSEAYADFFSSISAEAESRGYGTTLYITENIPGKENRIINEMASSRAECAVVVTSLPEPEKGYSTLIQGGMKVVFAERVGSSGSGVCFDMATAAEDMAGDIISCVQNGLEAGGIALVTNMTKYPNERCFKEHFEQKISEALPYLRIHHFEGVPLQFSKIAFQFFNKDLDPPILVTTSEEMAKELAMADELFCGGPERKRIYTFYHSSIVRPSRFICYTLDYRKLGRHAVAKAMEEVLDDGGKPEVLSCDGFAKPVRFSFARMDGKLTILTAETPMSHAVSQLLPLFHKQTGISVKLIEKPQREIPTLMERMDNFSPFDILRMDMALIDKVSERFFVPLQELDIDYPYILSRMQEGLEQEYCTCGDVPYTVPFDPSCTLLFYRKDLFEDSANRKRFQELYKHALDVPSSFKEYKDIALFFDRLNREGAIKESGAFLTHSPGEYVMQLIEKSSDGSLADISAEVFSSVIENFKDMEKNPDNVRMQFWSDAVSAFINGQCAMTMFYANYAERIFAKPLSGVSGRIGYARVPGNRALLGGGVLGVQRNSKHKEAAAEFISWIYSENISLLLALLAGSSPCREAYEKDEIINMYPWLPIVRDSFKNGIRRHIFTGVKKPFDQIALESGIGFACLNAVQDVISQEEALAYARDCYKKSRG